VATPEERLKYHVVRPFPQLVWYLVVSYLCHMTRRIIRHVAVQVANRASTPVSPDSRMSSYELVSNMTVTLRPHTLILHTSTPTHLPEGRLKYSRTASSSSQGLAEGERARTRYHTSSGFCQACTCNAKKMVSRALGGGQHQQNEGLPANRLCARCWPSIVCRVTWAPCETPLVVLPPLPPSGMTGGVATQEWPIHSPVAGQ
jgi:hypothetical protein